MLGAYHGRSLLHPPAERRRLESASWGSRDGDIRAGRTRVQVRLGSAPERRLAARKGLPALPTMQLPLHSTLYPVGGFGPSLPTVLGPHVRLANTPKLQGFSLGSRSDRKNVRHHSARLGILGDLRKAERATAEVATPLVSTATLLDGVALGSRAQELPNNKIEFGGPLDLREMARIVDNNFPRSLDVTFRSVRVRRTHQLVVFAPND